MGLPLMVPEGFIALIVGHPIGLHVVQNGRLTSSLEKLRDVGVGTLFITVLVIGTIAVVRPEAMYCP